MSQTLKSLDLKSQEERRPVLRAGFQSWWTGAQTEFHTQTRVWGRMLLREKVCISVFPQELTKTHSIWPWHRNWTEKETYVFKYIRENVVRILQKSWEASPCYLSPSDQRGNCGTKITPLCLIPYPSTYVTQEDVFTLHRLLTIPRPREKPKKWRNFKKKKYT